MARALALLVLAAVVVGETPVDKIIGLLERIDRQITMEGKEEAAEYDKFACFCKEQADEKLYNIEKSKQIIKDLKAKINDLTGRIADEEEDITALGERIDAIKGEVDDKTASRKESKKKYKEESDDLKGAIDALKRAIKALTDSKDKLKGDAKKMMFLQQTEGSLVTELLQVVQRSGHGLVSGEQFQRVMELAQDAQETDKPGKPHAYQYQSNSVIDILNNLQRDFLKELKKVYKDEFEKKAKFDSMILDLEEEKKFKVEDTTEKEAVVAKLTKEKEKAEGDKDDEKEAMDKDQGFLDELTTMCEDKGTVWNQRSTTRAAELTAINKAKEVLENGASSQYASASVALPQVKAGASFLQLRRKSVDSKSGAMQQVFTQLNRAAARLKSADLAKVAAELLSQHDFTKVKDLIDDLIAKLEDEAKKEADTKDFCNKGLKKAMESRDENTVEIEKKGAEIAKMGADNKILKKEVGTIMRELSEFHKSISEAQELRDKEKADNENTLSECNEGKEAVETALDVLKTFYEGAALLQKSPEDRDGNSLGDMAPETSFDGDYKGKQKQSKGVIGLLETILGDFEKTIADTKSEEEAAQKEFEDMNKDTLDNIDSLEQDQTKKEKTIKENEDKIIEFRDDVADAKKLHASALKELEKLQAMCVEGASSWEEKAKAREEEIKALNKAKGLLDKFTS